VQFRAGSSIRRSGGTLHPAAQLIANPRYNAFTIDFDVAVARISDNAITSLTFSQNPFQLGLNAINLLKTKGNLPYIRNQHVPRCKHFTQRL
jgi:hypothetical protein